MSESGEVPLTDDAITQKNFDNHSENEPNNILQEPTSGHLEGGRDKAEKSSGPGQLYESYLLSEAIVERLKLLDYESEFIPKSDSYKLIPRHYFVNRTNTGEQFFLFTNIAAWLINDKAKLSQMETPHEFDDPNATIANIIGALKANAIDVPFVSNKLKSGSGDQCLFVLDKLTEMALKNANFHFSKIEVVEEAVVESSEDNIQVDEAEILADQLEEEEDVALAEDEDDDDDHHIVRHNDTSLASRDHLYANELNEVPLKEILHNFTDANTMTAELRRVIPQLKVTIRSNLKDWRMHAEQIQKYEQSINDQFKEIKPYLMQNVEEITQSMERIQSREAHLNTQFDGLLQIYRVRQNELAAISEQYRESSGTLNSRAETLNNLNREIDQVKQQIEEQGMQNTNGTPILKIKQSISKLETAVFTMRVQIVVAEQALIQSQLSHRLNLTDVFD